jgi:hypothetical protein
MRRVKVNHSARLVAYLFHKGQITRDEAETFVATVLLADREIIREDDNLPPPLSLKMIAAVQGALGLTVLIWALIVGLAMGKPEGQAPVFDPTAPPGSLKVVAWPWAQIYIDGSYVETTPVARSFSLPAGVHEVTLRNPNFKTVTKQVLVEPAKLQKLKITLVRNKP